MLKAVNQQLEVLRSHHRKWIDFRTKVADQYDQMIAQVTEDGNRQINNLSIAKQDSIADYDEVLRQLEYQIQFLEGSDGTAQAS